MIMISIILILSLALGVGIAWKGVSKIFIPVIFSTFSGIGGYILGNGPTEYNLYYALYCAFGGIIFGFGSFFIAAYSLRNTKLGENFSDRARVGQAFLTLDFRVAAVIIGLCISLVFTLFFSNIANKEDPPGFWVGFYASWTSSLLFFAIVGLAAALTALHRPERDVFSARVRILFGGKQGPHIDYVAERIKTVGYYSSITTRSLQIEDVDCDRNAIKMRVIQHSKVMNVFHDVDTPAQCPLVVNIDNFEHQFEEYGELLSFKVESVKVGEVPVAFKSKKFERRGEAMISRGSHIDFSFEYWVWLSAKELHEFEVARFTEKLEVSIVNRCKDSAVQIRCAMGESSKSHNLVWDEPLTIGPISDAKPGKNSYEFKIEFSYPSNTILEIDDSSRDHSESDSA